MSLLILSAIFWVIIHTSVGIGTLIKMRSMFSEDEFEQKFVLWILFILPFYTLITAVSTFCIVLSRAYEQNFHESMGRVRVFVTVFLICLEFTPIFAGRVAYKRLKEEKRE